MSVPVSGGSQMEQAFRAFEDAILRGFDYANTVAPSLKENPRLLSERADSLVVLAMTRLDAFVSLVSLGTPLREREIRRYFAKHGDPLLDPTTAITIRVVAARECED